MTFPNTLILIAGLGLSVFAIGPESGDVLKEINLEPRSLGTPSNKGDELSDASVRLESIGIIGGKSKSEAAISAIHKYASQSAEFGAPKMAVDAIEEGLNCAIDLIVASIDAADKALASAIDKSCDKPEAAVIAIQKGMKTAKHLIYSSGFPIYYSFDAAGLITGDGSKNWIRLGMEFVEHGGTYAIASLEAAETLSIHGLKSNLVAAAKGFDAAREASITSYEAAFASLVLAGKLVFKGLADDATGSIKKDKHICTTQTTIQSPEAKAAKSAIRLSAERAIQTISQGPVTNALHKIEEGLMCGVEGAATGETSALRAISIATKIALNEPDIAKATFKAGVEALKIAILTAGNKTCEGLYEAANILGNQKINKIVSAIIKVQNGVTTALGDIGTAEKLTSIGLQFGGDVAKQGLKAVYKSVSAVLFVFYSLLVRIGQEAF